MAVEADYRACRESFADWSSQVLPVRKVVLCSADNEQTEIVRDLFRQAKVCNFSQDDWDLNSPCKTSTDLVVACNVFHYAKHPIDWFKNVFAACRWFWMQDLFIRRRSPQRDGLGDDGDQMRYTFGGACADEAPTFDLAFHRDRLLDLRFYDAGSLKSGRACINFVVSFRGDVT